MGLPHKVDHSTRGCALIHDIALFYVLYWPLVSNKKKERNSSRGVRNQGGRNKDALQNVDFSVDSPAQKKR